mgnify:CR=1 FL=1
MENKYRTHNCGELRLADAGKEVKIAGWVNSVRNLGGLTFMTVRDHFGLTQVILDGQEIPSKETVILLGLALELKENEIEELLNSASYSLPKNNVYDLIIRFCFIERIYDLKEVNNLLDSYECKLFSY